MIIDKYQKRIKKLEDEIQEAYRRYSIIDKVCTPVPVPKDDRIFRQFAKKFLIERIHITDDSHFLILENFGIGTARSEDNYLLEKIRLHSVCNEVNEINYEEIQNAVKQLKQNGFVPDAIFLPINYFHNVWDWNSIPYQNGQITENLGHQLVIDKNTILPIIFSNKYVPFNEVFVVTKKVNIWEYRPDAVTEGRLTTQFNWDYNDSKYTTLLIQTIFNLEIKNSNGNILLKPENIPNKRN